MAHDSFVQFLRRKQLGYAQFTARNAVASFERIFKHFEAMCTDPRADLRASVRTDDGPISLEQVRQKARSISESLPRLMSGTKVPDDQAATVIASLINTSLDLHDAARSYPHLRGSKDVEEEYEGLISLATELQGLFDSHAAGIEEGLKRGPATQTESRSSRAKTLRSHAGRSGGRS